MNQPKIKIFDPRNPIHRTAEELFNGAHDLPLICPHGHVDPGIFVDPVYKFQDPAALFILPDHYVLRMLVSQGYRLEAFGINPKGENEIPYDPLSVWRIFCEKFSSFDCTPTGLWIQNELAMIFGIYEKPAAGNADFLFNQIQSALNDEAFSPRSLFAEFRIETLCTTDAPESPLVKHRLIRESGWVGDIRPTFRADKIVNIGLPGWPERIQQLGDICGKEIHDFKGFLQAIEDRRLAFKTLGAVAIDHSIETPYTCRINPEEMRRIFQKGLKKQVSVDEARLFIGHMIVELARMSIEDGLVMQLRAGPYRNHHTKIFEKYGPDKGFDIPVRVEWTHNLKPLLDEFGLDPRLRLILFSLDESNYSRELGPLAGAYPAIKLGPPWWFHDSPNGMMRYFENVMETAGFENTVGFNDDTSAFLSIPARHDLWRRISALWLAKLVHRGQLDLTTAKNRMEDLSYHLAKAGYWLNRSN